MSREVVQLRRLAQGWGGDLVKIPKKEYQKIQEENNQLPFRSKNFEDAPFTASLIGVLHKAKQVLYAGDVSWTVMTHELGHCFASKKCPDKSDDFSFFGWELSLIDHIGGDLGEWEKDNRHYVVTPDGGCIMDLSRKTLDRIYQERRAYARKARLVSSSGVPLSIRG